MYGTAGQGNTITILSVFPVNNLERRAPSDSSPKPYTPELFGKLGRDRSFVAAAGTEDHELIESFTKVRVIVRFRVGE